MEQHGVVSPPQKKQTWGLCMEEDRLVTLERPLAEQCEAFPQGPSRHVGEERTSAGSSGRWSWCRSGLSP